MKTPLTQALEWIEERYQVNIPQNQKRQFLELEKQAILDAWDDGHAVGDLSIIITDSGEYYNQTYTNDTGSR
jgi:hypothetical protein